MVSCSNMQEAVQIQKHLNQTQFFFFNNFPERVPVLILPSPQTCFWVFGILKPFEKNFKKYGNNLLGHTLNNFIYSY